MTSTAGVSAVFALAGGFSGSVRQPCPRCTASVPAYLLAFLLGLVVLILVELIAHG
ncbi:MAG TPA: hypothetical protein VGF42_08725 [Caulobacteraceae bacterium]|jgi:hypothetical protein